MIVWKRYDLSDEDDKADYKLESNAMKMYLALEEMKSQIRSIWKYREYTTLEQAEESIEEIYQIVCDNYNNSGIDE